MLTGLRDRLGGKEKSKQSQFPSNLLMRKGKQQTDRLFVYLFQRRRRRMLGRKKS